MSVKIGVAETPQARDEVFKVRHKVFVEEEGLLRATDDGRIVDRFDAYPTTRLLAVTSGETVVGSLRVSLDSPVGVPADAYYDFRKHVPHTGYLMHTGLFCLSQKHRGAGLTVGLDLMAADYGIAHDVSHVVAPVNPRVGDLMRRCGFDAVGEQFVESHTGAEMIPMVGDLRRRDDWFIAFIEQHRLRDMVRDYERWFCRAGEAVVCGNTSREHVFLVVDGVIQVSAPRTGRKIAELGPGQFFGWLDMVSAELRSGDVVALDDAQMIVWSRERFVCDNFDRQALAEEIGHVFVKRTRKIIKRLVSSTASARAKGVLDPAPVRVGA